MIKKEIPERRRRRLLPIAGFALICGVATAFAINSAMAEAGEPVREGPGAAPLGTARDGAPVGVEPYTGQIHLPILNARTLPQVLGRRVLPSPTVQSQVDALNAAFDKCMAGYGAPKKILEEEAGEALSWTWDDPGLVAQKKCQGPLTASETYADLPEVRIAYLAAGALRVELNACLVERGATSAATAPESMFRTCVDFAQAAITR